MKIGITGVPGTGKTTVSNLLGERLGIEVVHISDLFKGEVSLKAVRAKLWWILMKKESVILEGHLLSDVKLPLDVVFVLRTRPDVLLERLKERGYDWQKVNENVLAEALDYCLQNAEERYKKIIQIDTTERHSIEVVDIMVRCLQGECEGDRVDWIPILERLIIRGMVYL